jgi:hypothetical protein
MLRQPSHVVQQAFGTFANSAMQEFDGTEPLVRVYWMETASYSSFFSGSAQRLQGLL